MTGELWIKRPPLPRKYKICIFKMPSLSHAPWILVMPAGKDERHVTVNYHRWEAAWAIAMSIQDQMNTP